LLHIDLPEGPYIVDVGFGNLTPTASLALRPEQVQATPHEPFRLMPQSNEFVLQVLVGQFFLELDDNELASIAAIMAAHGVDEEVHRAFV
jgi:arylamine N-acetyltransferase